MKIAPFELERFFAEYEFQVQHQLSNSDCEAMSVSELLNMTDGKDTYDLGGLHLGYTESLGAPRLRKAVSSLYSTVSSDGVLVAAPEEAIFLALNAHLKAGDHVIVTTPVYQSLHSVPQSLGCRVTPWPVELSAGKWELDFNYLQDHISSDTQMVIINIPHNPTGLCFTASQQKELISLLRPRNILLFSDEMYWQLEYAPGTSNTPFCDLYENTLSMSGLSKSYGLPGLRIGWLASQTEELLKPAAELKDYTTICSSAPSELLATAALENSRRLTDRCRRIVRTNLSLFGEFAERTSSIEFIPGQGGSILFPRLSDGLSASALSRRLIEKRNLLMLPGYLFNMPDSFFRLGLGRVKLPEALAIFEKELP